MLIRSFVALSVPKEMANTLGDAAAKMAYQDKSNAVRWVDQTNYHVTLAFLGDQEERSLEQLAEHLDEHLPQNALPISLNHFSPFPESRPKLIAAMVDNSREVKEVYKQVASSVQATGLHFERRRFSPHVTLGRIRHTRNPFLGSIPTMLELAGYADEVVLYESILSSHGAEYEPIFRFPLELMDYDYGGEYDDA